MAEEPRGGRRSKLTAERQVKICALIRAGNYAFVAAEVAGISQTTFFRWCEYGRKAQKEGRRSKYREFWEAVETAASEAEVLFVEQNRKAAAEGDVQAAQWWLMHRFPDRWGLQQSRQEQTGKEGGPIVIKVISTIPRPQVPEADGNDS